MVGTTVRKRTLAFAAVACLALAAALALPHTALAASVRYEGASPAADKAQVGAQASKTTVWVVTKRVYKSLSGTETESLSYDSNGLVKKQKEVYKFKGEPKQTITNTFSYGSNYKLKSGKTVESGDTTKVSFKCDNKGRVTKQTRKFSSGYSFVAKYKYNAKGQLTKELEMVGSRSYAYDKRGRVVKDTQYSDEHGSKTVVNYKYDKSGFVNQMLVGGEVEVTYNNTVKANRLTKRVEADQNGPRPITTTFTHKKLSVPKAAAKMVKAQQRCIIEGIQSLCTAHR